jgi:putative endonuclease
VIAMNARGALGRYGEDVAAALLQSMGMTILCRNWRCVAGELDIVARDGDALVVCEVKTRRSMSHGSPAEAVGPRKMQRLRALALHWLDEAEIYIPTVRFDVVGVILPRRGAPIVSYLRGVE